MLREHQYLVGVFMTAAMIQKLQIILWAASIPVGLYAWWRRWERIAFGALFLFLWLSLDVLILLNSIQRIWITLIGCGN